MLCLIYACVCSQADGMLKQYEVYRNRLPEALKYLTETVKTNVISFALVARCVVTNVDDNVLCRKN